MFKNRGLQFKITLSVIAYILVIGIAGNAFLYTYLSRAVSRKAEQLDWAYLEAVRFQLERNLADVFSLAVVCANDLTVLKATSRRERAANEIIRDSLNAQEQLNAFLHANPMNFYIDKLILFDNHGLFVQAVARQGGDSADPERIRLLPLYSTFVAENLPWVSGFGHSIASINPRDSYALLFRIQGSYHNSAEAYLYMEAGIDMITDVFREYGVPTGVFAQIPETGEAIMRDEQHLTASKTRDRIPADAEFPFRFREGRRIFRLDRLLLENNILALYNRVDVTNLATDDRYVLYTVLAMGLMSLLAAVGLGLMLSAILARPIQTLIGRIRKISDENDFSYDPAIEKQTDEIGLIGRAVNEMSDSIRRFLIETEEQYRQQKNTEIALLQTQINPHFLYNTLDSIQWMAKIQSNPSIADITRRLINLLRNIAARADSGGADIKIPLAEELRILEDYTEVMSVRFMGNFEVSNRIPGAFMDYRIPRLTLQPLVENAILHGIGPSDHLGFITLDAAENGEYLDIIVEDTGVGMSREQLENIKTRGRTREAGTPSLNNIGIANVDERLKLLYGESCGLFFESRPGEFTRVTIRIAAERQRNM